MSPRIISGGPGRSPAIRNARSKALAMLSGVGSSYIQERNTLGLVWSGGRGGSGGGTVTEVGGGGSGAPSGGSGATPILKQQILQAMADQGNASAFYNNQFVPVTTAPGGPGRIFAPSQPPRSITENLAPPPPLTQQQPVCPDGSMPNADGSCGQQGPQIQLCPDGSVPALDGSCPNAAPPVGDGGGGGGGGSDVGTVVCDPGTVFDPGSGGCVAQPATYRTTGHAGTFLDSVPTWAKYLGLAVAGGAAVYLLKGKRGRR